MMKKIFFIILAFFITTSCFAQDIDVMPSQTGVIIDSQYINTNNNIEQAKQIATVKILSGEFKDEIIEIENSLTGNPYYDIKLQKGTKVILHVEDNGDGIEFSVEDIKRSETLLWLSVLFCLLLIYVGKKKGVYSLISIAITVLLISNCLSPLILAGINPILATLVICIISTLLTMYLVGGFNAKSTSASLGVLLSIVFAGVLSAITIYTAHLTGFSGENTMFLYSAHPELNFINITVSAIILATLGAVMDVAMSIASTINEINETDNSKTVRELFTSGMNVGQDIIGTMANTLILVYIGGALPLILLANNIDLQKFINLNQVVTEIASALIGSIAIVICVPFTAMIAAMLIKKYDKKTDFETIDLNCN